MNITNITILGIAFILLLSWVIYATLSRHKGEQADVPAPKNHVQKHYQAFVQRRRILPFIPNNSSPEEMDALTEQYRRDRERVDNLIERRREYDRREAQICALNLPDEEIERLLQEMGSYPSSKDLENR